MNRYMTYNGEGLEQGMYTLDEAGAEFTDVEFDAETQTISVGERRNVRVEGDRVVLRKGSVLVSLNPADCTIIDDGQCKYPVLTADIEKSGKTFADLKRMNGDEYSAWCQDVSMAAPVNVGTQECIDICELLEDHGSEVWYIG